MGYFFGFTVAFGSPIHLEFISMWGLDALLNFSKGLFVPTSFIKKPIFSSDRNSLIDYLSLEQTPGQQWGPQKDTFTLLWNRSAPSLFGTERNNAHNRLCPTNATVKKTLLSPLHLCPFALWISHVCPARAWLMPTASEINTNLPAKRWAAWLYSTVPI